MMVLIGNTAIARSRVNRPSNKAKMMRYAGFKTVPPVLSTRNQFRRHLCLGDFHNQVDLDRPELLLLLSLPYSSDSKHCLQVLAQNHGFDLVIEPPLEPGLQLAPQQFIWPQPPGALPPLYEPFLR